MLNRREREALEWCRLYRKKRFNPVPSSMEPPKKPIYLFAEEFGWETPFPEAWFTEAAWEQRPTTNLQVMCGRSPWRLLVIDLDGEEAADIWRSWSRDRWLPRTWITHREGGHSKHLWFRLPKDYPTPLPKKFLWRGDGKHQGIERLCDNSLIVAPPSYHVEHKDSRYRFLDRHNSPDVLGLPAPCPDWILRLKPVVEEKPVPRFVPPPLRPNRTIRLDSEHLDRNEVLDGISDKVGLARSWGLRIAGSPRHSGWVPCHAFDRPDAKPSAAIHAASGTYTDRGSGMSLSLYDLMVAMGQAHDWKDALERLAQRYR